MAHLLDIPIRFRFLKLPAIWDLRAVQGQPHHEGQYFAFPKLLTDGEGSKVSELDGWSCRDEFFGIPEGDNEKLHKFLTNVGVFSNLELSGHWSKEVTQHCREGHPVPIDVQGLWNFRDGLRRALIDRKGFKEKYASPLPRPTTTLGMVKQSGAEFPLHFELESVALGVVTTTDAYHMLLATVFADVARDIRFKVCKREDCQRPFPITSEHTRKFCSQYCGHLVSQRKKRAAEQKKRRTEKLTKQQGKARAYV